MEFSRTYDLNYVHKCMTHPNVWRMSCNDVMKDVDPELFFLPDKIPMYFLKVDKYGILIGEPKGLRVYEAHVALLPEANGNAVEICASAIEWFFNNEECDKITAAIPSFNHLAKRLAKHVGMAFTGVRESSFLKDGVNYDLCLYEINKEDVCHP